MKKTKRTLIEERLARISQTKRGLTPEAVVADAKDPKSPLHSYFDWNDTVAARKWRIEQARELIRSVRVEITTNERTISVVRYVRDPKAKQNEPGYADVVQIRSDEEIAREAMCYEVECLGAIIDRVEPLASALGHSKEFMKFAVAFDALKKQFYREKKAA